MTYRLGRFGLPTNNQVLWCISNNFNVWKIPYCKHEVITWVMFSCDVQFNRLIDGSVDDVWSVNSWGERCCEEDKKVRSYSQEYVFKRTEIFQEMYGSVHATWCIIPKWQGSNKNSCQSMPWNRQLYLITLIVLYFFMSFYGFVSRIRLILFSERNRESLKCGWCVTYSTLFTGLSFFETLVSQLIFLFQTIVLNRCYRLHPYLALCLLGY